MIFFFFLLVFFDVNRHDYLLQTSFDEMTSEKIDVLNKNKQNKEKEVVELQNTAETEMWKRELLVLREKLSQHNTKDKGEHREEEAKPTPPRRGRKATK